PYTTLFRSPVTPFFLFCFIVSPKFLLLTSHSWSYTVRCTIQIVSFIIRVWHLLLHTLYLFFLHSNYPLFVRPIALLFQRNQQTHTTSGRLRLPSNMIEKLHRLFLVETTLCNQ